MKTSRLAVPANPCEVAQHRALVSRQPLELRRRIPTEWNKLLLAAMMGLGALGQVVEAASVKLAWNPNPESDIAGYLLSYSTSPGVAGSTLATGNVTTATVSGLVEGRTYYFSLKAVNTAGVQSASSAEISHLVPNSTSPPANQAPVAGSQLVTTAEDTARAITLAATDADGQALVYRILSQPTKGALTGTAPNLIYTPKAHVNGSDSFTFVAHDGVADSNVAVVAITINAVNDAPLAANQSLNATAGEPLALKLAASDPDGNSLTYRVIGNPAQGALSGTAPNLTYTPLAGASGADSFTFRANDGSADSNTATVAISITPPGNTSPLALIPRTGWQLVAVSSQETSGENGRATNAFDGNPNTIWHSRWSSNVALPPHEILIDLGKSESIQGFRYLPRQDGRTAANIGRYEFHVSGDGSNWGSPVANGSFVHDPTEKEVLFPATYGRYILLRAFEAADGGVSCSLAELNLLQGPAVIATPPPNVAPVATAQSVNTPEDQAIAIRLTANDANGDALGYRILRQPAMGTLSGSAPNLTYTPAADANGSDSFTFLVNDGTADSNTATVAIAISPVNDASMARSQELATLEDKSVGIFLEAVDKEGDPVSYKVVGLPSKGTLSGTAPNLTYTPNRDLNGSDSFTFVSNDGAVDSAPATVSIDITPVNDAPVAAARFVTTDADKSAVITLSASDKDGDSLSYMILSQPMKGVLSGTPPRVTYTPYPGAQGSDSFSFRVHDGTVNSNTAGIYLTVVPVVDPEANAAPEFQFEQIRRDVATVGEEYISAPLAGTAIDPDGDKITYSRSSGPEWLTVAADGSISGTPTENSQGVNNFTVRATDAEGAYAEASLEIEVMSNGLPLPWELARIGDVNPLSEASGDTLAIRLLSSGVLAGTADSGLFAYQPLIGDGEITVRIRELENSDTATRVGLMIRESMATTSKHTFIGTDGRGYVRWIRRTKTAGSTSTSSVAVTTPLGLWLRLNREGTTISAFTSANGSDWTRVGRVNVDLGTSCYIGLAAHSGADEKLSAAVFENITVTP